MRDAYNYVIGQNIEDKNQQINKKLLKEKSNKLIDTLYYQDFKIETPVSPETGKPNKLPFTIQRNKPSQSRKVRRIPEPPAPYRGGGDKIEIDMVFVIIYVFIIIILMFILLFLSQKKNYTKKLYYRNYY